MSLLWGLALGGMGFHLRQPSLAWVGLAATLKPRTSMVLRTVVERRWTVEVRTRRSAATSRSRCLLRLALLPINPDSGWEAELASKRARVVFLGLAAQAQ